MNNNYVYIHRRCDNNTVFYIGRGSKDRAKRKGKERNVNWHNVVKESKGFIVEYLAINLSREQAIAIENNYLQNIPEDWNLVNIKSSEIVKDVNNIYQTLHEYLEYDESSPSCLVWKCRNKSSPINIGDKAGHLNKKHNYYEIRLNGKQYYAHRLIYCMLNGELSSDLVIDHIDGNRSNNKISNLRAVSQRDNCRNRNIKANSKTGIVGVQLVMNPLGNRYYQASFIEDGIPKAKLFSVTKLGEDLALQSAIEYRLQKENNYE